MAGPEAKVKARVKKTLKSYGAYQHWPVQTGYGAACLDCHACYKGIYFAIETKAPGKHPTPRQLLTIDDVENAGGKVFVIGEALIGALYSGERELLEWLEEEAGPKNRAPGTCEHGNKVGGNYRCTWCDPL